MNSSFYLAFDTNIIYGCFILILANLMAATKFQKWKFQGVVGIFRAFENMRDMRYITVVIRYMFLYFIDTHYI